MGWNYLSTPKLQPHNRWSLEIDESFHLILYKACNFLSMLRPKLIHVNKRDPWRRRLWRTPSNFFVFWCVDFDAWYPGIILCIRPANGRRRYIVTSSLIGWAHAKIIPGLFITKDVEYHITRTLYQECRNLWGPRSKNLSLRRTTRPQPSRSWWCLTWHTFSVL